MELIGLAQALVVVIVAGLAIHTTRQLMETVDRASGGQVIPPVVRQVMDQIRRLDAERMHGQPGAWDAEPTELDEWDAIFTQETGVDPKTGEKVQKPVELTGHLARSLTIPDPAEMVPGSCWRMVCPTFGKGPEYQTCDCELCADDGRQVRRNHLVPSAYPAPDPDPDPDRPWHW